jgi:hypothetical protein
LRGLRSSIEEKTFINPARPFVSDGLGVHIGGRSGVPGAD